MPAKILLFDKLPISFTKTFEFEGYTFHVLEEKSAYVSLNDGKLHWTKLQDSSDFWVSLNNEYSCCVGRFYDIESFKQSIKFRIDDGSLKNAIDELLNDLNDLEGYEERQKQAIEDRRIQREKDDLIYNARVAERLQRALEQKENDLKEAEEKFKNNQKIPWDHFEELCKRAGIEMHIRTLGSGRKSINAISKDSATCAKRTKIDKAFMYAKRLYEHYHQKPEFYSVEDEEVIEKLFKKV